MSADELLAIAIIAAFLGFGFLVLGVLADAWEQRHPWTDRGDARRRNQARRLPK